MTATNGIVPDRTGQSRDSSQALESRQAREKIGCLASPELQRFDLDMIGRPALL
jgi:hypothetical protein